MLAECLEFPWIEARSGKEMRGKREEIRQFFFVDGGSSEGEEYERRERKLSSKNEVDARQNERFQDRALALWSECVESRRQASCRPVTNILQRTPREGMTLFLKRGDHSVPDRAADSGMLVDGDENVVMDIAVPSL